MVGEKVRIDDKWRVVIPAKYREGLKPRDELLVLKVGDDIILRKVSRDDILRMFRKVKLYASEDRVSVDAEEAKHRYGGFKE